MSKLKFGAVASILGLLVFAPAYAAPTYCTGTTQTVASGGNVPGSFLIDVATGASTGNCVEAADKIFGAFQATGSITGEGSSVFTFSMPTFNGDVTIGFQGSVAASTTGGVNYDVSVDPTLSGGLLIHDLQKDLTFNNVGTTTAMVTLTGTGTPLNPGVSATNPVLNFDCVRHSPANADTCPEHLLFSQLESEIGVNETITTDANSVVTGLTDTISQALPTGVFEPSSLTILGDALLSMAWMMRRRQQS